MSIQLKLRRGTTAQHSTFTGASGEVTVDTDKKTLVVHDGATPGGNALVTKTGAETLTNKTLTAPVINGFTGDTSVVNIGSGQFYKNASGNVGIGTSSPSQKLEVAGTIKSTSSTGALLQNSTATGSNALRIVNNSGSVYFGTENSAGTDYSLPAYAPFIYANYSTPICFVSNGSERMRIDSSGNVGIGTSSPSAKLNVTTGATGVQALFANGTGTPTIAVGATTTTYNTQIGYNVSSEYGYIQAVAAAGVYDDIAINPNGGNLLVGATSQLNNEKLSIQVSSGKPLAMKVPSTSAYSQVDFNNPNGVVGVISTNGSSTTYATSSDYRLKENIAPMTGALSVVHQLNPVTYNWKADGSEGQGFIAHELQAVVPDCVTGEKDAVDADGNPVYQGIDTSFLVATLTAAIQEQQAIITQLQADVDALKQGGV